MIFPTNFRWGVATSALQIEGLAGRGLSIWDDFCRQPGKIAGDANAAIACDFYHRWPQDLELLKDLGVNSYRFSIAWPRVLPEGRGLVNQTGLDFYDRIINKLLKYDISPFVTLYQWDLPSALQAQGGWQSPEIITAFEEYVAIVTARFGDRVKHWLTLNEPWCVATLGHARGVHAPGLQNRRAALQVAHNLLLAHGRSVPLIRANSPAAQIGIALNITPFYVTEKLPHNYENAHREDGEFNRWYLEPLFAGRYPSDIWDYYGADVPQISPADMDVISTPLDFLGINYYTRGVLGPQLTNALRTATGWEVYPKGLYDTLLRVYRKYKPPAIYITENGAAFTDPTTAPINDEARRQFLEQHIVAAHRAINDGVPLKGYFAWSLLDSFEWDYGYDARFGLYAVDFATQQRTLKLSGEWYRNFIVTQQFGGTKDAIGF